MRNTMLAPPVTSNYQFAVYSGAYKLDLTTEPEQPQALFADRQVAISYAGAKWPSTYEVVDLWESYP